MITYRIVAYLIALAVGYWVLTVAEKEQNLNKKLGKVIGWIIIIVSLCGPLCLAGSHMICRSGSANCCWMQGCCKMDHGNMMGGPGGSECPMGKSGSMGTTPETGNKGKEK